MFIYILSWIYLQYPTSVFTCQLIFWGTSLYICADKINSFLFPDDGLTNQIICSFALYVLTVSLVQLYLKILIFYCEKMSTPSPFRKTKLFAGVRMQCSLISSRGNCRWLRSFKAPFPEMIPVNNRFLHTQCHTDTKMSNRHGKKTKLHQWKILFEDTNKCWCNNLHNAVW